MLKIFKRNNLRKASSLLFLAAYIFLYPSPIEVYSLNFSDNAQVFFYSEEMPANTQNCTVINTGSYYEIKTDSENAKKIRDIINVSYQTVVFNGNADYVIRYLGINNFSIAEIEGGRLYTGYSAIINGRKLCGGRINIQVYCKNGLIYIGNPVIYGSY